MAVVTGQKNKKFEIETGGLEFGSRDSGFAFSGNPRPLRQGGGRRDQHRPACNGGILHPGETGPAGTGNSQLRWKYDAMYGKRRFRIQALFWQRRASGKL